MAQSTIEAAFAKFEAMRSSRARAFTDELNRVRNAAAANGSFRSGGMMLSMAAIAENEIWNRAATLWTEIVSAHQNRGQPIDADNSPEMFRKAIDSQVELEYRAIMQEYEALTKVVGYPPAGQPHQIVAGLVGKLNAARTLYAIEVPEYFVKLRNERDKDAARGNTYNNFSGPALVSTGANATNTQIVTINQAQRDSATAAIAELIAYLKSAQADAIAQRMDVLEAAIAARHELAQPRPDKSKLMEWFTVITGTLQTYAAIPQVQAALLALTQLT